MRKMISVLLAGVLAVNLGACSSAASKASKEAESAAPAGTTAQESGGKRTLRIAGESWQVTKLFLNEAAEAIMKDHPDVTVEVQTYADPTVVSNYSINWQKGDTPCDLVVIDGASFAEQFVTKDLIYDFDQDLKFFDTYSKDKFIPAALEMAKLHDKQYVIPVIQEVTAININKAMFKDAGLVDENGDALVPKTWDDVYEFAKKLTKTENGVVTQQGCTIQWSKDIHGTVLGILQASCGGLYQEDGITVNFQSQEFKDILAIWQKGVKEGVFSTETFADYDAGKNSYKAGKVAMLLQSGSNWVEAIPTIGEDNASVVPIPGGEENGSVGYVNGVIIPKCSPSSDLAVQFVQEQLLGEYTQTSTVNQYGKIPVITEYYNKTESPNWQNIKGSIEKAVTYPPYKDLGEFVIKCQEIFQASLVDGTDVNTTAEELQNMVNKLDK